jgi:hypothetical protein
MHTRKFKYSLMCVALLSAFALNASTSRAQSSQVVLRYKDVVGTYKADGSVFSIDRAPQGRLKIEFQGVYEYSTGRGRMANLGSAYGTAKLIGNTALFTPRETTGCTIKLVFKPRKLIVTQSGNDTDCGFGHNVNASDTYKLTSRRPEHFDEFGEPEKMTH